MNMNIHEDMCPPTPLVEICDDVSIFGIRENSGKHQDRFTWLVGTGDVTAVGWANPSFWGTQQVKVYVLLYTNTCKISTFSSHKIYQSDAFSFLIETNQNAFLLLIQTNQIHFNFYFRPIKCISFPV